MLLERSSQYWIDESEIEDLEEFKESFTLVPKYENLEPICTLVRRGTKWGFPRNSDLSSQGCEVIDRTTLGNPLPTPVEFLGEMFDYQETAILEFMERTKRGVFDLILSAQTGAGKTVMMLKMWQLAQVPLLVIVPKSDLIEQWQERIKQFTGLEDKHIGLARQNTCTWKGKPVVIGMLHSICKDKYSEEFKNHFGMVAFDELHKLGAKTFSQAGCLFPARYRLGATATLRRPDGMSDIFYSHLGTDVIKPKKGDQPDPKIIFVKYTMSSGKLPGWARQKMQRRGLLFSMLSSNMDRLDWVAFYTKQLYDSGRQTLVLGERVAMLQNLIKMLEGGEYKIPKSHIGLYIGKTSPAKRKRIAKECRIIVATTSMLALGTDIPTLRGLVFATPLADVEQPVGRICRFSLEKFQPVVIDFLDTAHKDCYNWYRARVALYKRKEWEVVYADEQ
jgi:superfamily II DNA or RNA helicase